VLGLFVLGLRLHDLKELGPFVEVVKGLGFRVQDLKELGLFVEVVELHAVPGGLV